MTWADFSVSQFKYSNVYSAAEQFVMERLGIHLGMAFRMHSFIHSFLHSNSSTITTTSHILDHSFRQKGKMYSQLFPFPGAVLLPLSLPLPHLSPPCYIAIPLIPHVLLPMDSTDSVSIPG